MDAWISPYQHTPKLQQKQQDEHHAATAVIVWKPKSKAQYSEGQSTDFMPQAAPFGLKAFELTAAYPGYPLIVRSLFRNTASACFFASIIALSVIMPLCLYASVVGALCAHTQQPLFRAFVLLCVYSIQYAAEARCS